MTIKRLGTISGLGVLLLLFLAVVFLLTPKGKQLVLNRVIHTLEQQTGLQIRVGEFQTNYFSSFQLSEIQVTDRTNDGFITVSNLRAEYQIFPLFRSRIVIDSITSSGFHLKLDRSVIDRYTSLQEPLPSDGKQKWKFYVHSVHVENSSILYEDTGTGDRVYLGGISLRVQHQDTLLLSVNTISGDIAGYTLNEFSASASAQHADSAWIADSVSLKSPETTLLAHEVRFTPEKYELSAVLTGVLGEDILEVIHGRLQEEPARSLRLTPVTFEGNVRSIGFSQIYYQSLLKMEQFQYDTLHVHGISIRLDGNADSLSLRRFRAFVGPTPGDTLSVSGSVDWKEKLVGVDFDTELSSLAVPKQVIQRNDMPVEGRLQLTGWAKIPYQSPELLSIQFTANLLDPSISKQKIPSIRLQAAINNKDVQAKLSDEYNTILISGQIAQPLQFQGEALITLLTDYGITTGFEDSIRLHSAFSGLYRSPSDFALAGSLKTHYTLNNMDLKTDVRVQYEVTPDTILLSNGVAQVNDLMPSRWRGAIGYQFPMGGYLQVDEPGRDTSGIRVHFDYNRDGDFSGEFSAQHLSLNRWSSLALARPENLHGFINIRSKLIFNPDMLTGEGALKVLDFRAGNTVIDSIFVGYSLDRTGITITEGQGYASDISAAISGKIPFQSKRPVRLNIKGSDWPLALANPFIPRGWHIQGALTSDLTLTGSLKSPILRGSAQLNNGFLQWNEQRRPIEDVTAKLEFNGKLFELDFMSLRYMDYPIDITGTGSMSPRFQGDISIRPIGEISVYYDRKTGDTLMIAGSRVPISILGDYLPARLLANRNATAQFHVSGRIADTSFSTSGQIQPNIGLGDSTWTLTWDGSLNDNLLRVQNVEFVSNFGSIVTSGSGRALFAPQMQLTKYQIDAEIKDFSLNYINNIQTKYLVESGMLNASLHIENSSGMPDITGRVHARNVGVRHPIKSFSITSGRFESTFLDSIVQINEFSGELNGYPATITGSGGYSQNGDIHLEATGTYNRDKVFSVAYRENMETETISGAVKFDAIQLDHFSSLIPGQKTVQGLTAGNIRLTGTKDAPALDISITGRDVYLAKSLFNSVTLRSHYKNGWFHLDTLSALFPEGKLQTTGKLSLDATLHELSAINFGRHADFHGEITNFPLSALEILFEKPLGIQGEMTTTISYRHTPDTRSVDGSFIADNIRFSLPYFSQKVEYGKLRADFNTNNITIRSGMVRIGEDVVQMTGSVSLDAGSPQYDVQLHTSHLKLTKPKEMTAVLAPSDLRVITRPRDPTYIEGNVRFSRFRYSKTIRNIRLETQLLSLAGSRTVKPTAFTENMLQDIRLNLGVQMINAAKVDNNLADIEFQTDVQVSGPLFQPKYSGRIIGQSGSIKYLGYEFQLQDATVYFQGTPVLNPAINIHATTKVPAHENVDDIDYTIGLNITNTLKQPHVTFSSTPARRPKTGEILSQSDIIGLMVTGRPREQFSTVVGEGNFQDFLLRQAIRLSSDRIASTVEYRVGRLFDLDRVAIEGNLYNLNSSNTPTFIAQKDLSDRLTLTYSSSIGYSNEQGVRLNYELTPQLYLVTETSQQEEYGIDLKYRIKFK